jgi:hypothetical protein
MLRLYYSAMTSAFRCRWALEETGLPHEIVHLSLARAEHKSPEYRKIHPLGSVPALVDGDQVVLERRRSACTSPRRIRSGASCPRRARSAALITISGSSSA